MNICPCSSTGHVLDVSASSTQLFCFLPHSFIAGLSCFFCLRVMSVCQPQEVLEGVCLQSTVSRQLYYWKTFLFHIWYEQYDKKTFGKVICVMIWLTKHSILGNCCGWTEQPDKFLCTCASCPCASLGRCAVNSYVFACFYFLPLWFYTMACFTFLT
jgi:hypothetical protein